ncbi:MAG: DUF3108 domain-containing protein [Mariniphaga sp.]|nr:DUF3108 domain-containing protein [Mariniphaga sp.]
MKIRIFLLLLLLISSLYIDAQEIFNPAIKPNTAFMAGETLTYQIRYGFIVGGTTTLSLVDTVYKNHQVFHAMAIGQTTGVADKLYGVRDIYESWFDKETNLPYKQIRNIKEGHYKNYNEVTYNRNNNTVNSKLSGVHQVPEKILDLASTFYYLRRVDFSTIKEGDILFVNMYFSDEIFPFHLRYRGKEIIKTKFGKIRCIKISPVVEVGRMFKSPDDLSIWFTDDDNRLPVMVKMDIRIVGAVFLKLVKYENILSPLATE